MAAYFKNKQQILALLKGDKGDKGDTGAKIVKTELIGQDANGGNFYKQTFDDGRTAGFIAPKGADGVSFRIGEVITGEAGTPAKVENKGTTSDVVLDITLPKGDKGDKGDKGERGEKGEKGDTPDLPIKILNYGPADYGGDNIDKIFDVGIYLFPGRPYVGISPFSGYNGAFWLEVEGNVFNFAEGGLNQNSFARQFVSLGSKFATRSISMKEGWTWSEWVEIDLLEISPSGENAECVAKKIKDYSGDFKELENGLYHIETTAGAILPSIATVGDSVFVWVQYDEHRNKRVTLAMQNKIAFMTYDYATQTWTDWEAIDLTNLGAGTGIKTITEQHTIPASAWETLANSQPFFYQTTITLTSELSENTVISLVNDNPVFFANFGLVLANIDGQDLTIYATNIPVGDTNIKICLENYAYGEN